jgi:2-oxoisovalerate dehydrogenase E1 component
VEPKDLEFLLDAYSRMQVIRVVEEQATELTKGATAAIAGSIHPCAGQEAIPVGAISGLRSDDRVVATYRGHGWALECGVTPFELLAEMCQKQGGVNGGRAGSLMVSDPHRRLVGQNSIVGAGGPIACGVAIAARAQGTRRVVAVSFGDGAVSQGGMHEALIMAASERLPVIFVCENNGWAEMTPNSYVNPFEISKRAAAYGIRAFTVDGCDPLQVRNAVAEAAEFARKGGGPTFLECTTIRLWGHYNRDIQHYRSMTDRQSAAAHDPIKRLRLELEQSGVGSAKLDAIDKAIVSKVQVAVEESLASPLPDPASLRENLFAAPSVEGSGVAVAGKVVRMSYAAGVNRALHDAMESREDVIVFGEDVAKPGGVFGLTRNLLKKFGASRVFDTPIAESAILGSAVGAAIEGSRPVAEVMFGDFLLVALDQLINQAANVRYVSNGKSSAPLVVRTQQGVTPGSCAQHSQCLEGLLAAIPGLKVGLPSTPEDAYCMLRAAIEDPDPCVLFEARSLFLMEGEVLIGGTPEPVFGARSLRKGSDVAIITWGTAIYSALEAADQLSAETGLQANVLNLRWLSPLDDEAIKKVVHECGRVLVVHDAARTGGFGAEIAARITERHSGKLKSPVRRIGAEDVRMPASPVLQRAVIPSVAKILSVLIELTNAKLAIA